MKKVLAAAGIATLLMAVAPITANAAPAHGAHVQQSHNVRGYAQHAHGSKHIRHSNRSYTHVSKRYVRHDFNHWRPGLERAHYKRFSAPVYSRGHYNVRAYDSHDRLVMLTISALTGVIIASSY